jgi:hypothetical protein
MRGLLRSIPALAATVALVLAPIGFAASAGPGKPGHGKPKRHRVDLTGATKMIGGTIIPGPVHDAGTVSGKPFGKSAKIKLTVQLDLATTSAAGTFRIRDGRGTALGTVDMTFVIAGGEIDFDGTADFTAGKGRYKGIEGTGLKAHDHNTLDGQNGTVSLRGFATW